MNDVRNILVYNKKGGAGKSTLALHLGVAWLGLRPKDCVRFVDLDTQDSLDDTRDAFKRFKRAEFHALAPDDCGPILKLPGLNVFDSPNLLSERDFEIFMGVVDILIIPMMAESEPLKAAKRTLKAAQGIRPDLLVKVAITAYSGAKDTKGEKPGPKIKGLAQAEFGPLLCRSIVPRSSTFAGAANEGQSVFQYAPDSSAAKAYRKLTAEIFKDLL